MVNQESEDQRDQKETREKEIFLEMILSVTRSP